MFVAIFNFFKLFDVFSGKALDDDNNHISQSTTIPAINVKWHPLFPNILYSANANGSIMMYDRDKKKQTLLIKGRLSIKLIFF